MKLNKKNKLLFLFVGITVISLLLVPAMVAPSSKIDNVSLTREDSKTSAFSKFEFSTSEFFAEGDSLVPVIVETTSQDYAMLATQVESLGGYIKIEYNNINGVSINIPTSALYALAESPLVVRVFKDEFKEFNVLKEETDTYMLMSDANIGANPISLSLSEEYPSTYANSYLTNAEAIWEDTNYGDGVKVAIIDTGCWSEPWEDPYGNMRYPWYWDAVYGGIDLSYDVGNPTYEGYGNPMNHWHGTGCAALIAASVLLTFYPSPDPPYSPHPWGTAIYTHDPYGSFFNSTNNQTSVVCMGIAPGAEIYAVKVFDHTGGGVPSSIIMEGIDAAIDEGVDVISMSLGGGVGAPGVDPEDLLVDAATAKGITVVASAGNDGPAPLRVGSPGTSTTAITVGAAMDPIHERVYADIAYFPGFAPYYYPSDDIFIADFSARGPTSDGRNKPDVVATGSWTFFGAPPSAWPSTIYLAGGTSFSCPQVAGEAALLMAYIKNEGLEFGPLEVKKAIVEGAVTLEGYQDFEQGSGYINCLNSLDLIKAMVEEVVEQNCHHRCKSNHHIDCHQNGGNNHYASLWFPPLELLDFHGGVATVDDITLEPGKYNYFNFWVSEEVDSIRISLSGIQYADLSEQNLYFLDDGVMYLSTAVREGIDDYLVYGEYFYYYDSFVIEISSDVHFQPGVQRLVLAGDFSAFNNIEIEKMTIEVVKTQAYKCGKWMFISNSGVDVDEAQVSLYNGEIITDYGKVREGEYDLYSFTIPDLGHEQLAIIELSWLRDWSKWATSDLDILIYQLFPDGYYYLVNVDGATGRSPEFVQLTEPGTYLIMIDGYQVYFDQNERYTLEIIYFSNLVETWQSKVFSLDSWLTIVKLPNRKKGIAILWLHSVSDYWDYWYMGDIIKV